MMGPFMGGISPKFGIELIFSFVIIVVSAMIYYSTKELYELSSHRGIKYFRLAFLFFAIAYFFRSFIKFIMVYFGVVDMRAMYSNPVLGLVTLLLFSYFNAMAVFYLVQSVLYKRLNDKFVYVFHLVALLFSLSILIFMSALVLVIINTILLVFVFVAYYFANKEAKKKNSLSVIYGLLAIFWIASFIDIFLPSIFQNFQLLIYLVSISAFLAMLYKVLRKVGAN